MTFPIAMKRTPRAIALLISASAAGLTSSLFATNKPDLKRYEPVPANEPIPIADFFRQRLLVEPKISPSGTHVAARMSGDDDKYYLMAYDFKTKQKESIGAHGDEEIYEFSWVNDKRLLFSVSLNKLYGLGLYGADLGKFNEAYPLLQYCGAKLISLAPDQGTQPLIWARYELDVDMQRDGGVVEVDTNLHTGRILNLHAALTDRNDVIDVRDNNEKHIRDRYPLVPGGLGVAYLANKSGKLEFGLSAENGVLAMYQLHDRNRWEKCAVDLEDMEVLGPGDKDGEILVLAARGSGKPNAVQFMDAASGKIGDLLFQDKEYDFDGWLYRDPSSHEVVGAVYQRNGPNVLWLSESYRTLQKLLDGYFPGLVVRLLGSDDGKKIFLVSVSSDRQPPIYNWVNLETRTIGLIKNSAPWIDPKRMQPMNIIKYKTRDGHRLDAYLTMPAGATKQNPPPLVVLPHGGPWVRDTWGFDGEVQLLASRGYAILQPNYRGSPGYNWMFPSEDQWDFLKMHDDVTDAVKAVISSGLVDRDRVAIMGGSFGGYLALSGVVKEPTLYRCAVTIAGAFDWEDMIRNANYDRFNDSRYQRLLRKLGDPKKHAAKFDAISPLRHVDQVRVPMFVSHGKDDPVVDVSESRKLISELERHHIPHEYLLVSGEGHGMHHINNQVELYEHILAFLDKNLIHAAPLPSHPLAALTATAGH
jgi:dipeptidyl aminopeptidase/acylaminoacyl peptidase